MTPYYTTPQHLMYCQAPAKLNLFLHVVGTRPDGYHLLESVFQLISLMDYVHVKRRDDGRIMRNHSLDTIPLATDLTIRAAQLLKEATNTPYGADITLEKNIPIGGGLGGGSSDAATTLLALNHLWQTKLPQKQLMELGLQLGADIPFFLLGSNALVQGIGEKLHPITPTFSWYVVMAPRVIVSTQTIFSSSLLTSDTPSITVSDFKQYPNGCWKNDLQPVTLKLFSEVENAFDWLSRYGKANMTGSGGCLFCACKDEAKASFILNDLIRSRCPHPAHKTKALATHPFIDWLAKQDTQLKS